MTLNDAWSSFVHFAVVAEEVRLAEAEVHSAAEHLLEVVFPVEELRAALVVAAAERQVPVSGAVGAAATRVAVEAADDNCSNDERGGIWRVRSFG